ncbi:hypothetical protein SAMN05428988_1487 [Chitinophaga sp. YR573]|nr:hypothetical protein SAMN05428988_1487 [Chitinophaga sp. YR573]
MLQFYIRKAIFMPARSAKANRYVIKYLFEAPKYYDRVGLVPSVGVLTAMIILTEIRNINQLKSTDRLLYSPL